MTWKIGRKGSATSGSANHLLGGARLIGWIVVPGMVSGCPSETWPVLLPTGPVTLTERNLLLTAAALMLIVVMPVLVMTGWFVWRYRSSRSGDAYAPD